MKYRVYFICGGSSNLQLVGDAHRTLNSPYWHRASFAFRCVVWRFVASNSTWSFCWNVCVRLNGPLFLISLAAVRSAVVTSLRICSRYCTRSSTLCTQVCRYSGGSKAGWKPYHISKGDLWVLQCGRALCANSIMGRSVAQLFCWKFLHICRYCLSSWLTCSNSPSVCR